MSQYLSFLFVATTALTILLFWKALPKESWRWVIVLMLWVALQALLSINNVYSGHIHALPPLIVRFGILPITVALLFIGWRKRGRKWIDKMSIEGLLLLSIVRIPVEIGLHGLYREGAVPRIMTFLGANFDILAGITAPLLLLLLRTNKNSAFSKNALLVWNIVFLITLLWVVTLALFSAPTPIQKFGFEQPNVAVFSFPVSWLPTFIVPVMLFSHLALFRKIARLPA